MKWPFSIRLAVLVLCAIKNNIYYLHTKNRLLLPTFARKVHLPISALWVYQLVRLRIIILFFHLHLFISLCTKRGLLLFRTEHIETKVSRSRSNSSDHFIPAIGYFGNIERAAHLWYFCIKTLGSILINLQVASYVNYFLQQFLLVPRRNCYKNSSLLELCVTFSNI